MVQPSPKDMARFMRFVSPEPNSGCWLFDGPATPRGYGQFSMGRKRRVYAHRFAAEFLGGSVVKREARVRHRCDVPSCVNPDHLVVGTQQENIADMVLSRT